MIVNRLISKWMRSSARHGRLVLDEPGYRRGVGWGGGALLVVVLAALAGTTAGAAAAERETIVPARAPVYVDLQIGSLKHVMRYSSRASKAKRARMLRQVQAAHRSHPDRLIVLRFQDMPLRYAGLSSQERKQVTRAAPSKYRKKTYQRKLGDLYERNAAKFVGDVVRQSEGNGPISVAGLPFEDGRSRKGRLDAAGLNHRYRGTIARLDAFVASGTFILADHASNVSTVRRGLPRSIALAEGRPIFFAANHSWWMLTAGREAGEAAEMAGGEAEGHGAAVAAPAAAVGPESEAGNAAKAARSERGLQIAWIDPPAEYVLGSGKAIGLRVAGVPERGVKVVFQTFSKATGSMEGPYPDYEAPFAYRGAALETVPAGAAELQAVVRDGSNRVLQVARHNLVFRASGDGGNAGWEGQVAKNDQGSQAFEELSVEAQEEGQESGEAKPKCRTLIYERTLSDAVRAYAESLGAERCINIPSWFGDREKEGTIDLVQLQEGLDERIPVDYDGYATLDFEKPYRAWLREGPGSPQFEQAQSEMLKALQYAKANRPLTKWAFWGEPHMRNWVEHPPSGKTRMYDKHAPEARQWLLDRACAASFLAEQDWYCPSAYDEFWSDEKSFGPECQAMVTTDLIMRCRDMSGGEKPVIACVWNRIHDFTYRLLPKDEWASDQILLSLQVGADGVAWWSHGYNYWANFRERSLEEHTSPEVETMTEEEAIVYWDTMLREYSEFLVSEVADHGQE